MSTIPGYWMHETSGELSRVVRKYLHGGPLRDDELGVMRAYLRQWCAGFPGREAQALHARVSRIASIDGLRAWLEDARAAGIDPL